jgi:exopolysaccharide biosynthesis polyprenyl glycosylphosphotransferase
MAAPDLFASSLCAERIATRGMDRAALRREQLKNALALAEAAGDFLATGLGLLAAFSMGALISFHGLPHRLPQGAAAMSAIVGLLAVVLMRRDRGRRGGSGLLRIEETQCAIRNSMQSLLLLPIITALLGLGFPWLVLLIAMLTTPAMLVLEKQLFLAAASRLQQRTKGVRRAVIYGGGKSGRSVLSTLLHSHRLGFYPVAVIDDKHTHFGGALPAMGYRKRASVPIRPGPVTPALLKSLQCDLLLVATQDLSLEELVAAQRAAFQAEIDVAVPAGAAVPEQRMEVIDADGLLFTSTIERPEPWHYAANKRVLDVVASCFLLILLAPILFLISLLIRLDSAGPALFVQERVGRNGEVFKMFKFRSMRLDAPRYSPSPISSNDERITRIGRFLRKMNLDELPQLLNVVVGDMSLVGPRPEMPFLVERHAAAHRERLQVTPGITGLWQLSADRAFPIHENIEYDLYYIRNRSLVMDVAVLAHTLLFAMGGGI